MGTSEAVRQDKQPKMCPCNGNIWNAVLRRVHLPSNVPTKTSRRRGPIPILSASLNLWSWPVTITMASVGDRPQIEFSTKSVPHSLSPNSARSPKVPTTTMHRENPTSPLIPNTTRDIPPPEIRDTVGPMAEASRVHARSRHRYFTLASKSKHPSPPRRAVYPSTVGAMSNNSFHHILSLWIGRCPTLMMGLRLTWLSFPETAIQRARTGSRAE